MKRFFLFLILLLCLSGCAKETEETTAEMPTEEISPEKNLRHFNNFGLISETVSVGNLRDAPSFSGRIIGRFYANTGMEILDNSNPSWYRVQSGGIIGYVSSELVLTGKKALEQCYRYGNYWAQIQSDSAELLSEADRGGEILLKLHRGETYPITEDVGEWYRIETKNGAGYVHKLSCRAGYQVAQAENWSLMDGMSDSARKITEYGMTFLGAPYKYGGESMTKGCDCSYFVAMCFHEADVHLPRTSREQVLRGTGVSLSEKQPGDLLFYSTHGDMIDHVAIYLGDNKILHAAQSVGCVSISEYNYCGEPVAVRRLI